MNNILSKLAADSMLLLPEIVLIIGATVVLFGAFFAKKKTKLLGVLSLLTLIIAGIFLFNVPTGRIGFFGLYKSDGFAVLFKAIVLWVSALTVLLSINFNDEKGYESAEYFSLMLFSVVGMFLMVSANDLLTIFVSLELMAIAVYVLVGYYKFNSLSSEAAFKYFILGAFSSGFFVFGASVLYGLTGTTRLDLLMSKIPAIAPQFGLFAIIAVVFILVAVGFKVALFPFHQWAPDAYTGAPTPITAFMSVAPKAAALGIFIRIFLTAFNGVKADWIPALAALSFMTMIWGNFAAIRQENIKRMLAYSSIAHAGYMVLGIIAGTQFAVKAVLLYLAAYSFMNIGAFAIIVILSKKEGYGENVEDFKGLAHNHPVLAAIMLIFMLSLAGIPPTIGFFAKFILFGAAVQAGQYFLVTVAVLTSAVSLYYYFRVVKVMYLKEVEFKHTFVLTPCERAVVFLTILGTLVAGIYPTPLFDAIKSIFSV